MDFDVVRVVKNDKKHEGCCIPTDTAVSKSPISIAIMNEYVKFSRRKKLSSFPLHHYNTFLSDTILRLNDGSKCVVGFYSKTRVKLGVRNGGWGGVLK